MPKQKKKSISERKLVEEECDFVTTVFMGVETVQNLKEVVHIRRSPNVERQNATNSCRNVYDSWDDIDVKDRFSLTPKNVDFILNRIKHCIEKTRINILPSPIESDRQLALTIGRLVHSRYFAVSEFQNL